MDLRPVTEDFSVSPQIAPEDLPAIAAAGYRSVLCNRPDGEAPGQPDVKAIEAAAKAAGLEFRAVPITSGQVTEQDLAAFNAALAEEPSPVLAYCRSGTRCVMLWSIAQMGRMEPERIVAAAAGAGYDMSGLVAQLQRG
ncbi:TIGR01244 family phosphatase [Roseovarius spongiae]|uniref:TIGR01244 family phosphatase n=1 Tax=Roseovarius spongiae TaxID=2320272 RepID=A0A3A8AVQ2_9RHOB|nr:TIGR01244 family sulfur transferase [Roseovarius spongiae]RKF13452.1 TIGR01244 family phosphatase [Roseovarius spongiae]